MIAESLAGYLVLLVAFFLVVPWLTKLRGTPQPRPSTAVIASLLEVVLISAAAAYLTPFTSTPVWPWWILAAMVLAGALSIALRWDQLVIVRAPDTESVAGSASATPVALPAARKLVSLVICSALLLILLYARFR